MALYILLALVGVPLLEIWVFIEVGGRIGTWNTIAIVLLTGVVGTLLLRVQGLGVLARVRDSLDRGVMPVAEVFDGLCLLVAGAVLLTPGFVTDTIGILLFVPAFRRSIGHWLAQRFMASGKVWVDGRPHGGPGGHGPGGRPRRDNGSDRIIEGEFREVDDDAEDPPPPTDSRWGRR